MQRINYSSSSPWEPLRGYSRAVQIGDSLWISGTTAVDRQGAVIGIDNAYLQTKFILERIKLILSRAGFALTDVVRTRLCITHMNKWDEYARAHREAFEDIRPVSSIVQVSKLVDPRLMIEMEVDAMKGVVAVERVPLD